MTSILSPSPSLNTIPSKCSVSFVPRARDYFAFARIKDDVCLVQASCATPASALTTVDVKIFKHEFISIFRFSESRTLHPADINILEPIDEQLTRYEEESETVFLARDVMERMRKLSTPRRHTLGVNGQGYTRRTMVVRQRQRQR